MLKRTFIFVSVFISSMLFAQQFQTDYGTPHNEDAYAIDRTADGGFILSGSSSANGTGGTDAMLTKTDGAGNLQWSKIYGGTGNELAIYVKTIPGGGFVFSGETFSADPAGDAFIAKADANGNLVWWKNYGTPGYDIAYDIKPLPDGTFIVSGLVESATASYDAFIMHADANGDSLWTRRFSAPGIEHAVKVIPTSDNGFLFVGKMLTYAATPGWSDVWLVKMDAAGDTLWTNIIGGPLWDEGMDVMESNGGYVICGGESSFGSGLYDVLLLKTDLAGNLLWSKTYGGAYIEDCYSIVEAPSGGYAIAGYTETFGPGNSRGTDSSNAFVIRTDYNGDTLWAMSYGGLLKEECFSIANIPGGFALAGYTGSFGDSLNAYIFTTDSLGISGCNERRAHPDVLINPGFVETHQGVTVLRGLTKTVPAISESLLNAVHDSLLCPGPLAIAEEINTNGISVFPNPASEQLILKWDGKQNDETVTIFIYDVTGKCVFTAERNLLRNARVDVTGLTDGIYFIVLRSGKEQVNTRVMIAN